jgi:hypothetical protein
VLPDKIQLVGGNGDLPMCFLMGRALGILLDDPGIGQTVEFLHGNVGHGHRNIRNPESGGFPLPVHVLEEVVEIRCVQLNIFVVFIQTHLYKTHGKARTAVPLRRPV